VHCQILAPKILTLQIDMILEIEQYKDDRHPTQIFFLDEKEKYGQTGTEICLLDNDGRIRIRLMTTIRQSYKKIVQYGDNQN
jgi:hypothetical protein